MFTSDIQAEIEDLYGITFGTYVKTLIRNDMKKIILAAIVMN